MIIDLATAPNSTPIKGLEIKTIEKADSPYVYKISDKDIISILEIATSCPITEAYIVEHGEIEEEWALIVYFDIPLSRRWLEDEECVFDITRMDGTPTDLV